MTSQHADLLVTDGIVLTPSGEMQVDLACRSGQLVAMGNLAEQWTATNTLSAKGLHVLPGVMDTQVHFREPGMTHKETIESGTRGAVLGGVTAVFEMPNTNPLTLDENDLQAKLAIAKQTAHCDYAFYLGGSAVNAEQLAVLETLPGCAGIKVFMGSSFGDLLADDNAVLERILSSGRRRVAIHAEDETRLTQRRHLVEESGDIKQHPFWRDEESAISATRRIIALSEKTKRPIHILHITTQQEIRLLAQHKHHVSVEVTPHHLTMTAPDCYERLGSLAQMNPPVRDITHRKALWAAIENGVVDVLGSDHAPHTLDEKARPYPNSPSGMTGVQTLLPLMLNHVNQGRLSLQRLVDLTSAGPARLFHMRNKGRIAVGYDADFSIVDLSAKRTIRNDWIASVVGWTPYDGMQIKGWPIHTVIRGVPVVEDETLTDIPFQACPVQFQDY